jgi:predicted ATPase/DNA-binding XRE family transcriptional regulator
MSSISPFGSWLKERRKLLDLTQEKLGQRIGYSGRTLEKIESGERRASRQIAELLAEAFEIPEDERIAFVLFARTGSLMPDIGSDANAPWKGSSLPGASHHHPTSLPAERTGFIGREDALADALTLLQRVDVRLLTLTGPPGIGKTRLSIQVAARAEGSFEDGVFFVELAAVRDPDMVPSAIAHSLLLRESGTIPIIESLEEHLKNKQMLLVLDNFEQVMPAASVLGSLLSRSSRLKMLVSSREALRIYGEHHFPVHPLSLPGEGVVLRPEELLGYDAIRLFVERAEAFDPHFRLTEENAATVVEICRDLEGAPLAIELAAARTWDLSPEEIRAGLGDMLALLTGGPKDLPARQQTLRGAVDWSYDLLSDHEQTLFRRVAVFMGGFTAEAAQAACNLEGEPTLNIGSLLASLVNKNLLQRGGGEGAARRYRMLETMREYAWERLVESGEAEAIQRLHARYYMTFAEDAAPHLRGQERAAWFDLLEMDHTNLRAALDWSLANSGELEPIVVGLRLGGALGHFWEMRGYPREGRDYLGRLLGDSGNVPQTLRVKALGAAGRLALYHGDFQTARTLYGQALDIRRGLGALPDIATALSDLAVVVRADADYTYARMLYEESLKIRRELGDLPGVASSLNGLATGLMFEGDYTQARAFAGEGLKIRRELRSKPGIALSLHILGDIERALGNYEVAGALYKESLDLSEESGSRPGVANALHNLGHIAHHEGEIEKARDLFKQALTMYDDWDDKPGIVECLTGLAAVAVSDGQTERAARLFGAAEALAEATRFHLAPPDHAEYERSVTVARAKLGKELFLQATLLGRATTLDRAIDSALNDE